MPLRWFCLLLPALGCVAHRPVTIDLVPDAEVAEEKAFVAGVAKNMPLWDADSIARYERVEIATVKADIAMASREEGKVRFLLDAARLHMDWDALVALDRVLKRELLT